VKRLALALLVLMLVPAALPGAAHAFVRTKATSGKPLYWSSGCVFVVSAAEGTPDVPGDLEATVLPKVIDNWNRSLAACSYMTLKYDAEPIPDHEVGYDGTNIVKFRQDKWCRPATKDAPEKCYAPQAVGITTVFYVDKADSSEDGRLLDADIELNGVNFRFAVDGMTDDATPGQIVADVENTLTHEVGHLLGLDHTCNDNPSVPTFDGNNARVPTCGSGDVTAEMRDATMYAFQEDGEIKKSSLEPDDIAGACDAYPTAKNPKSCKRVDVDGGDGCACATGGRRDGGGAAAALLLAVALAAARRRRRR